MSKSRHSIGFARIHVAEALEPRVFLTASMLADINAVTETSDPSWMTVSNGVLYFSANDGVHGNELWRSDGTAAGTRLVADLAPGGTPSFPSHLTAAGDKLFFTTAGPDINGQLNLTGGGLWVSDGTAAGTTKISEVKALNEYPFRAVGGRLYFTIDLPASGYGLWTSDGTTDGTRSLNTPNYAQVYTDLDGVAYFAAQDTEHGSELWRTDGTIEGTRLVRDVAPGEAHGLRGRAAAFHDAVYFAGAQGLWKTDGTEQGTQFLYAANDPASFTVIGNRLYFQAPDDQGVRRLFVTDGTADGTRLAANLALSDNSLPYELNGSVYVWAGRLYHLDDSPNGVEPITDSFVPSPIGALEAGGYLYFVSYLSQSRIGDLWRTDGTAAGTVKLPVENFPFYQDAQLNFVKLGDSVYFNLGEPYVVRGGTDDIQLLIDINVVAPYGSDPTSFTTAGDYTYFLTHGHVWRTDGTPQGTIEVFDSGVRDFDRDSWTSAAVGSSLVIDLADKLWLVGPTAGSQKLLMTFAGRYYGGQPVAVGSKVYFTGKTDVFDKVRLWAYDTAVDAAPHEVTGAFVLNEPADSLYAAGDRIYFTAEPAGTFDAEPWVIDSATDEARLVKDVRPGKEGSTPLFLTHVGTTLYFTAIDETGSRRIWKSDGSEAGTRPVAGAPIPVGSIGDPDHFTSTGQALYLIARGPNDATRDFELWKIALDGSDVSSRVADLTPGEGGTILDELTAVGDQVYFTAFDQLYGTDGTASGTRQLSTNLNGRSFNQGQQIIRPVSLTPAGGLVYFLAHDGARGVELWRTDGTPEGTVIVDDLNPQGDGLFTPDFAFSWISDITAVGDQVIFAGNDGVHGLEPWAARDGGEPLVDAGGPYATIEGRAITVPATSRAGADGAPIVSYEWDFDYELSKGVFTSDATGAVASYVGRDGPSRSHVAVRVTDAAGKSRIDTAYVQIDNVSPTVTVTGAPDVEEGAPYVLHFSATDPGADTIKRWTVNGGDNSLPTLSGTADSATLIFKDGPLRRVVEVRAFDDDGSYVTRLEVNVLNVAPHDVNIGLDQETTEGSAVSFNGNFIDPGVDDRWTYRWRAYDASGGVAFQGAQKSFTFLPAEAGDYRVEFIVRDKDGATGSDEAILHVQNAPPQIDLGGDRTANEGEKVTFEPVIADPGGGAIASVWWKATSDFGWSIDGVGAPFSFVPPDDGRYVVDVTATDAAGASTDASAIVTVRDVPPTLSVAAPGAVFSDTPLVLTFGATDPGTDSIDHWTIDWGDGVVETAPGGATSATHRYSRADDFTLAVATTDEQGTYAAPQKVVHVRDRPRLDEQGVLIVTGTNADNDVQITAADGTVRVTVDGATAEFPATAVRRGVVDALAGVDRLVFTGGSGDDVFRIGGDVVRLANGTLQLPIEHSHVETVRVEGAGGNDRAELNPAAPSTSSSLQVAGGPDDDALLIDDQTNPAGRDFSIDDSHSVGWIGSPPVLHDGVEHIEIQAGAGPDVFRIEPDVTADVAIDAGAPGTATDVGDRLILLNFNAFGGRRVATAGDTGDFTFADHRPIHYADIESYEGPDLVWPTIIAARHSGKEFEVDFDKEMAQPILPASLRLLNLDTGLPIDAVVFPLAIDPARPRTLRWSMQYELGSGHYRATVDVFDVGGNPVAEPRTFDFTVPFAEAVSRRLFYFHGGDIDLNNLQYAPDKQALLPGEAPTFTNISSYVQGITGIELTYRRLSFYAQFKFEIIRNGVAESLAPAGGFGTGEQPDGSRRVGFVWPNGTIKNAWLRVTVDPNDYPPFEKPEVFYFGSLVGETGDAGSPTTVTASDLVRVRNAVGRRAGLDDPFDIDRNGVVNASDLVFLRNSVGRSISLVARGPAKTIFSPTLTVTPSPSTLVDSVRDEEDASQ